MFDIITDSACDLTPEMTQKMGVEVVPFYVSLDGEHIIKILQNGREVIRATGDEREQAFQMAARDLVRRFPAKGR